ncbi:hypothetical protein CgunFtcFv8_005362 [Champsocephalus gunnari]|uniref:Uncharacterized protein n=1 Tax=Champsocephalus gunnari TaxID=52237 RepID=A0AAN8CWA4_CHAGU|nr:hypothetical protein CgunFtcFv8_005362 [Champsocephalus gunnari]
MRLAEEARLIRLQEEKKLAEENKIKDEEDDFLAEEVRVKMAERIRQERERVMQRQLEEIRAQAHAEALSATQTQVEKQVMKVEKAAYVENLTEAITKEWEKELRKKGKLPSDIMPPSEETMRHNGKQKHRAEWRHMGESKMAKINVSQE